jgi:hypothetical protein
MKGRMQTRINDDGYWEYLDPSTGTWKATHRRAAERKLGRLRPGFHVHHLDGNKLNNRHSNLVEVHPTVHGRLHASPDACLRCGRDSHWAAECYATTFYDGSALVE